MNITGGWHRARIALESVIDAIFAVEPESIYEFDSILSADEINTLGYVRNFPHLTCLMCSIDEPHRHLISTGETLLSSENVEPVFKLALLPAACYKVYLTHSGMHLKEEKLIGCIAKCFRNEDKELDAFRAMNFTMKEIVCLGSADGAKRHLDTGLDKIGAMLERLKIPFSCEVASDPFFDATSSTARLSKLLPTKREILYKDHAIASLNYHRNYFGEKFGISMEGQAANTSCVAFGIERWISMFEEVFESPSDAVAALADCRTVET